MSPTSPAGSLAAPPASRAEASALDMFRRSSLFFPLVGLVVVSALMAVAGDAFLSIENFTNILRQVSVIAIIAVGMTFVILSGGIDLSVGAVMALAGTVAAGLMASGIDPVLAFCCAAHRYRLWHAQRGIDRLCRHAIDYRDLGNYGHRARSFTHLFRRLSD